MDNKKIIMEFIKEEFKDVNLEDVEEIFQKYLEQLVERKQKEMEEEDSLEDSIEERLSRLSESKLREIYVPDVYQKSIYDIDYDKLWDNGIRLLSFDIDDTIGDVMLNNIKAKVSFCKFAMPKKAIKLFEKLKEKGFIVTLITNAMPEIAQRTYMVLRTDNYIARAEKPGTNSFELMLSRYDMKKSQMAHIGNSIHDDVAGGNKTGIVTCLVRRAGKAMKIKNTAKKVLGKCTPGHQIRMELAKYGLWHKHHMVKKGDQYYQFGEIQKYSPNFKE